MKKIGKLIGRIWQVMERVWVDSTQWMTTSQTPPPNEVKPLV